jgi:hypothetical protein
VRRAGGACCSRARAVASAGARMRKAILFSTILASMVIPAHAAAMTNAKQGFDKMVRRMVLFNLLYAIAVVYIYPHV